MKCKILTLIYVLLAIPAFSQNGTKPFVLGAIDEIYSAELSEKRTLNIYLPAGYNVKDTAKYPVVYLLDGSADEDFIHVVGLYQFNNFAWIDRVPKSIIVGISNTDRKRDFTYPTTLAEEKKRYPTTGGSEKFMQFLANELQPFISKKYNANSVQTIIGQSLAGLFVTEVLLKRPALFDKYIIISPSLWWDNGSLLKVHSKILAENTELSIDVYVGVGKEGLAPSDIPHVMEVDANLLVEKIKSYKNESLNVDFDYLPQENHATITHQAVFNALRFLYPINK